MSTAPTDSDAPAMARRLRDWHRLGLRQSFPWQQDRTPYSVWVSEIMLQQTRAETVVPYYLRFMERFGDVATLGGAEVDEVLKLWSGLGYYGRARNLHRSAQMLLQTSHGQLPADLGELLALPGIGRSTAGAIMTLGMGQRGVILDGNIKRVLARLYAVEGGNSQAAWLKELWRLADGLTPHEPDASADHAQAMMNLGAIVCRARGPDCPACPLADNCKAQALGLQADFPPRHSPRRARPRRELDWLLMLDSQGRLLLQRRPPAGLWGGLWTLPELQTDADTHAACRQLAGTEPGAVEKFGTVKHSFTHFDLTARLLRADLPSPTATIIAEQDCLLIDPAKALEDLALPTPVRRLIEQLKDSE